MRDAIDAKRLRSVLEYDAASGAFIWISDRGNGRRGKLAGSINVDGYLCIKVDKKLYGAHRLAWLYVYGEFPTHEIDHIDGNRLNNAIINLRDVTHQQNMHNQCNAQKHNGTNIFGVSRNGKSFAARIRINGKQLWLGTFKTKAAAHEAYLKTKRELHPDAVSIFIKGA